VREPRSGARVCARTRHAYVRSRCSDTTVCFADASGRRALGAPPLPWTGQPFLHMRSVLIPISWDALAIYRQSYGFSLVFPTL
jgi:hypothetical protein